MPRIIQLIMIDKKSPEEIVDTFDFTHVQMYYQNNTICGTKTSISQLKTKMTNFTKTHYVPNRLIKYFEKGMNISDKIFTNDNFIFSDSIEKLHKYKSQKKIYSITNNLTIYPDGTQIDFTNWNKHKLDLGKLYFDKCAIYYAKPDNKDIMLDINMVGKFLDYFHLNNDRNRKRFFDCKNKGLKNDDYSYGQIDKDSSYTIHNYYTQIPNSASKIIASSELSYFYLPCKFIKYEEFNYESMNYVCGHFIIKKGIRAYFKLMDKNIINKLL
jgi:hypothetical protein